MRRDKEVMDQLLAFATADARVRAVVQNGSRVNPRVVQDLFCDYDIIFFVTEPKSFLLDQEWIGPLGRLVMLQQNDIHQQEEEYYIFLMQFEDGVRIDLSFRQAESARWCLTDSLTLPLLDKDGILPDLPAPDDRTYQTAKPDRKRFDATINDIWWCSAYVAKGLWRDELPYAKYMLDVVIRNGVVELLSWYASAEKSWQLNVGKAGKWLKRELPPEVWEAFERTYAGAGEEENWEALLEVNSLVRRVGVELAEQLGYDYPYEDDRRMTAFLQRIRSLDKGAMDM